MTDEPALAGWYADPNEEFELRYWDGEAWTAHVWRSGVQSTSEIQATPPTTPAMNTRSLDHAGETVIQPRIDKSAICENGHPLPAGESKCSQCGARIKMQWMSEEHAAGEHHPASPSAARQGREGWHLIGWLALYSVAGAVAWKLFTAILSDGRDEGANLFGLVGLVLSGQIWA